MNNWFAMGDYGFYVWGAYGTSLSILIINVVWTRIKRRTIIKQLKRYFQRLKQ